MPVLVTGCGRSGTGWASRLLGCHHEKQFTPTRHGPLTESESSWLAIPYLNELAPETQIVRVIRSPYDVVASAYRRGFLATPGNAYGDFARHHCPQIADGGDHLGQVIRWVAYWDAPLEDYHHAVLVVDGGHGTAGRDVVSGHPDENLIHARAERWGYM